jgi:hypothetical protein
MKSKFSESFKLRNLIPLSTEDLKKADSFRD